MTLDIPAKFTPPRTDYNYTVRDVMIPMRGEPGWSTISVLWMGGRMC